MEWGKVLLCYVMPDNGIVCLYVTKLRRIAESGRSVGSSFFSLFRSFLDVISFFAFHSPSLSFFHSFIHLYLSILSPSPAYPTVASSSPHNTYCNNTNTQLYSIFQKQPLRQPFHFLLTTNKPTQRTPSNSLIHPTWLPQALPSMASRLVVSFLQWISCPVAFQAPLNFSFAFLATPWTFIYYQYLDN